MPQKTSSQVEQQAAQRATPQVTPQAARLIQPTQPENQTTKHTIEHAKITMVCLARHDEVYNPDKTLYGRLPDWHLSEHDWRQATATALFFEDHNIHHFICSPPQCTQEIPQPFTGMIGTKPSLDEDLLEAGNTLEGLRIRGIDPALQNPEYWSWLRYPSIPNQGEPHEEIADHIFRVAERARETAGSAEAVLVTH